MIRLFTAAMLVLLWGPGLMYAQSPQSLGSATTQLPPPPPPSKSRKDQPPGQPPISQALRSEALARAKVNALNRYIAEQESALATVFESVRGDIEAAIDEYLLNTVVIEETVTPPTYSVVVRVDINRPRLERRLKTGAASSASRVPDRMLTFVFVAREQASVTEYDATVSRTASETAAVSSTSNASQTISAQADARSARQETSQSALDATQQERIGAARVALQDREKRVDGEEARSRATAEATLAVEAALEEKASAEVAATVGGRRERKADDVKWRVFQANEINQVLTGLFASVGYEVVEAEYLEPESGGLLSLDAIRADFGAGDDMKPATLRNTAQGAKRAEVPFVVYGAMDVGLREPDPVSGLPRVTVTVNAKALDVRGRLPRTVSAIGPVQYSGTGENATVARTNALKLAALEAGKLLIAELGGNPQ
jgi:hypothetical protein